MDILRDPFGYGGNTYLDRVGSFTYYSTYTALWGKAYIIHTIVSYVRITYVGCWISPWRRCSKYRTDPDLKSYPFQGYWKWTRKPPFLVRRGIIRESPSHCQTSPGLSVQVTAISQWSEQLSLLNWWGGEVPRDIYWEVRIRIVRSLFSSHCLILWSGFALEWNKVSPLLARKILYVWPLHR